MIIGTKCNRCARAIVKIFPFFENNLYQSGDTQLYFFIFSIVYYSKIPLLFWNPQRAVSYTERTALIILLFSNEFVDADGSVPAHKMHGTGWICELPLRSSSINFTRLFREQKKKEINKREKKNYLSITSETRRALWNHSVAVYHLPEN